MENVPPDWNPYGGAIIALGIMVLTFVATLVLLGLARWARKRVR